MGSGWRRLSPLLMPCLAILFLGSSCRSAGALQEQRFVVPDRFEWWSPDIPPWTLVENRRTPWQTRVRYRHASSHAELLVRADPLTSRQAELPLDVLGQLLFLKRVNVAGGIPALDSQVRIVLDDREAVAMVGSRYERPMRTRVGMILLRSQGFLVELRYSAPQEQFDALAGEFEKLMRHFKVLLPGKFDPFLLEELPMGAPAPSPLDWRGTREQKSDQPLLPDGRKLPW